jgi:hypothetical protein
MFWVAQGTVKFLRMVQLLVITINSLLTCEMCTWCNILSAAQWFNFSLLCSRYAWTIAECRYCHKHMGWKFTATQKLMKPQKFWGICRRSIVTKLVTEEDLEPIIWNSDILFAEYIQVHILFVFNLVSFSYILRLWPPVSCMIFCRIDCILFL